MASTPTSFCAPTATVTNASVKSKVQSPKSKVRWATFDFGPQGLCLHALDYNPDYARIARLRAHRYGLDLNVVVGAGEQLPYPDESFDAVVCLDVLEHVSDVESVLGEVRRVLKPGGVVL